MPTFSINKRKSLTNEKINDTVFRRVITSERVQHLKKIFLLLIGVFFIVLIMQMIVTIISQVFSLTCMNFIFLLFS